MEVNDLLAPPAALPQETRSIYPLDTWLDWPQSWQGRGDEGKSF
jgi:hypothetical protein